MNIWKPTGKPNNVDVWASLLEVPFSKFAPSLRTTLALSRAVSVSLRALFSSLSSLIIFYELHWKFSSLKLLLWYPSPDYPEWHSRIGTEHGDAQMQQNPGTYDTWGHWIDDKVDPVELWKGKWLSNTELASDGIFFLTSPLLVQLSLVWHEASMLRPQNFGGCCSLAWSVSHLAACSNSVPRRKFSFRKINTSK